MSNLPESFTGDWITPDHPRYSEAIARWAINAERRAKVVAFVKSAQDVATVLKYGKQYKLPVAIRGGGHSTSGASSVEDGVVIDLSRYLSSVRVDPVEKLAYIGGGAIWETVDKAAIQHGLATVGGTVNHTGVGGLLLGGGYGFLTGKHGLTIDNLVQATVVTAGGEILAANSTENADLFWGIRGAGCNFGVVTEFVLRLHPQRRTVFAGILAYPPPLIPNAAATAAKFWDAGLDENEAITYALTMDPAGSGHPLALLFIFWNGSEEEGRSHFKPLFDLGPVLDTCKEIPFEEVNSVQNIHLKHGRNYYMKGIFATGLQVDVAQNLMSLLPELSTKRGINFNVIYEFMPTKKVLSVPNSATALIRAFRANVLLLATWDDKDPSKLDAVRSAAIELRRIVIQGERTIPESLNVGYGNYYSEEVTSASAGSGADSEALFGENYRKLQKLKKKYDPDLVFFKWNPITPEA
ncbi:FAD-binding domain-containing protein [Russula earlei]|uniref:FAD-binding domain-containing protein n=2 Tax=Russula earlei TaxID=71964 RepID=A0ACC0TY51_9AGAM|nr:FAD-binding domain-containing protein [Russula earlei]KAI9453193.1 FAD-binding domain-containing protein [Russula earlei]